MQDKNLIKALLQESRNRNSFFSLLPVDLINKVNMSYLAGEDYYSRILSINIVGESNAGKSALMKRFVSDSYSEHKLQGGNNSDTKSICLANQVVKLKVNVIKEVFSINSQLRSAHATILLIDASNETSFNSAKVQLAATQRQQSEHSGKVIVVFTKSDLLDPSFKDSRAVAKFEEETGFRARFVSSLTGDNVVNMFESLAASVCATLDAGSKNAGKTDADRTPAPSNTGNGCSIS